MVAAPLLFGRMHVAPLVSRFLAAYPRASAELMLSDRFSSLVEDGVDVAVRIGELADSALVARRLGRTRRMVVASPAYLAAHGGGPETPSDLARHGTIAFRAMTPVREWAFRQPSGRSVTVEVEPRLITDSADVAIAHAVEGGGITACLGYQVDAALRSGALVEVLARYAPQPVPIQAVFPTARLMSRKVRVFLDVVEQAAADWSFLGHPR